MTLKLKERVQVQLKVRDRVISADLTDTDSLALLGFIYLTPDERQRFSQQGGDDAIAKEVQKRSQAHQDELKRKKVEALGRDLNEKELEDLHIEINTTFATSLLHRVNLNTGGIRTDVAQRLSEIFPGIEPEVSYSEWLDRGQQYRRGSIRLTAKELMNVILTAIAQQSVDLDIDPAEELKAAGKPATPGNGFAKPVEVPTPVIEEKPEVITLSVGEAIEAAKPDVLAQLKEMGINPDDLSAEKRAALGV